MEYHRISLSSPAEIIGRIKLLDAALPDMICIARGGGENMDVFEHLEIAEALLSCKTIVASAIGHAEDVTLFEKLSDKKFITPTQFGHYLKDMYNTTIGELQHSKARIVQDTRTQLAAVFAKEVENLRQQLTGEKALHEKAVTETKRSHDAQLLVLNSKLKSFEELASKAVQDKTGLHATEITNLKKQADTQQQLHRSELAQLQRQQQQKDTLIEQANRLAAGYRQQLEVEKARPRTSFGAVVVAVIIGLILGALLFSKH